jgi:hypothetical protein
MKKWFLELLITEPQTKTARVARAVAFRVAILFTTLVIIMALAILASVGVEGWLNLKTGPWFAIVLGALIFILALIARVIMTK